MIFSRVVAAFFAIGAVGVLARPSPVEARQDPTDVLAVLDTLKSSTDTILPQIDGLVNSNTATEENLTPLLNQLVTALNTGSTSIDGLKGKVNANADQQDVANRAAAVTTNVAKTLDNAKTKNPHLYPFFLKFGLEAALYKILFGLGVVLAGVLKLVAVLLKDVAFLLTGLGWSLILGLLVL